MVPTDVCNIALAEMGNRVKISSFAETSPAAQAAALFYRPKTQALLRGANWDFARAQQTLAVWKAATINGTTSANPPPQPWLYSYLWPSDCVKARFIQPTLPTATPGVPLTTAPVGQFFAQPSITSIPFVPATDLDQNGNPIKVILTNLPAAQLIYTRDLSQSPDLWDSLFLNGCTAYLAAYFINALARNKAQFDDQVAIARGALDQARVANGNEGISNVDHAPDWLRARTVGGASWSFNGGRPGLYGGWDTVPFPDGQFY